MSRLPVSLSSFEYLSSLEKLKISTMKISNNADMHLLHVIYVYLTFDSFKRHVLDTFIHFPRKNLHGMETNCLHRREQQWIEFKTLYKTQMNENHETTFTEIFTPTHNCVKFRQQYNQFSKLSFLYK